MTQELTIKEGERLHELRTQLLGLVATATEHFFRMGVIMKEIRDKELWRGQYQSFGTFFSDPEFSFKRSSVYHAIRLVEVFPEWEKLVDVPVSKLMIIAPHMTPKNKEDLVSHARSLSASDLYHHMETQALVAQNPKYVPLPKIFSCNVCHKVKGISFDTLCHCGWTPAQIEHVSKLIDAVEFGEV